MSGMNGLYREMIDGLCALIGYEEAYHLLAKEAIDRCDSTTRQALDKEGAFAKEVAEILKENPAWDIKFEKTGDGFKMTASIPASSTSNEEISRQKTRIENAFNRYKRINLPGIAAKVEIQRLTIEPEAD